jgi:phosphopantothenoylcysteine decarboxylase/phosphopantothenate--cysteine ligase
VTAEGAGFDVDTNRITILDRDGSEEAFPLLSKEYAADAVIDRVVRRLTQSSASEVTPSPAKPGS